MNNYHGYLKNTSFFEGWYLKHQAGGHTLALIPGIHMDQKGNRKAFVQLITQKESRYFEYPFSEFHVKPKTFGVKVGENVFSEKGCRLYLNESGFSLYGTLRYGAFSPLSYDIMGPFAPAAFLPCHHGVLSMAHSVSGQLSVNGESVSFDGGKGYIEKDWGKSFPPAYFWTQCNDLPGDRAVMAAGAKLPIGRAALWGSIAAVFCEGQEYRIATYLGAEILEMDGTSLHLRQRDLRLRADVTGGQAHALKAPVLGGMERAVHESVDARVRYRFYKNDRLVFDLEGGHAGFEYAGEEG